MKKLIAVACCAAILGSVSIAAAQTTGPQGQQSMKQNDPMNANARMKKKKMKKGMMKQGGMSDGMNSGMSGGGMGQGMSKQGGMSGGGMTK